MTTNLLDKSLSDSASVDVAPGHGPGNAPGTDVPHWSATRLKCYLTCPRQYRYSYVDAIPTVSTSPLVFGRTLHEALCFVHERQMQSGQLPLVIEVLDQFDALWQRALDNEQPFFRPTAPSPEQHQRTGHEILRAYLAVPANAAPPLAAEFTFQVQAGDYHLAGIVDRIEESDGGLILLDFKSGSRRPTETELQGELQFILYAFAIGKMLGQSVERVVHYHLRDGSRFNVEPGENQFAWLLDEVLPYVAGGVGRREFAPRPGYWCNYCDYRELCRAENTMGQQHFMDEPTGQPMGNSIGNPVDNSSVDNLVAISTSNSAEVL